VSEAKSLRVIFMVVVNYRRCKCTAPGKRRSAMQNN
jgi:hypothetical protein